MKAYEKRIRAKFKKLDKLREVGTAKDVRKQSDYWDKRTPSPGKYWNAKSARAVASGTAR